MAAVNSGISASLVSKYNGYEAGKENTLSGAKLSAVESGITSALVEKYNGYDSRIDGKVTIDDRISGVSEQTDLSVVKLGSEEYA